MSKLIIVAVKHRLHYPRVILLNRTEQPNGNIGFGEFALAAARKIGVVERASRHECLPL